MESKQIKVDKINKLKKLKKHRAYCWSPKCIDYRIMLHCGNEKVWNLIPFQSHNAALSNNQYILEISNMVCGTSHFGTGCLLPPPPPPPASTSLQFSLVPALILTYSYCLSLVKGALKYFFSGLMYSSLSLKGLMIICIYRWNLLGCSSVSFSCEIDKIIWFQRSIGTITLTSIHAV